MVLAHVHRDVYVVSYSILITNTSINYYVDLKQTNILGNIREKVRETFNLSTSKLNTLNFETDQLNSKIQVHKMFVRLAISTRGQTSRVISSSYNVEYTQV